MTACCWAKRCLPALLLSLLAGFSTAQDGPQEDLPRAQLTIRQQMIEVQLAATPEQRQIGLMHRKSLPEHEGMLFIYQDDALRCFWMRHTPLPLTAAFMDKQGIIVDLADMHPLTDKSHCSTQPVRYVLEMPQGWFDKHDIKAGERLKGELFEPDVDTQ